MSNPERLNPERLKPECLSVVCVVDVVQSLRPPPPAYTGKMVFFPDAKNDILAWSTLAVLDLTIFVVNHAVLG